ncbi:MAG: ferrochelatase [Cyclobacteriaceae bacterium]
MATRAVLLTNLGSPDSYQVKDVRKYLDEFLMDKRVIDVPYFLRWLLVKGIIVPLRAPRSAAKYRTIWTGQGSPLIEISRQVQHKLSLEMRMPVELCMRYANPTPNDAFRKLLDENPDLREVVLVPLYPHYAMSSYETAVEHVEQAYAVGKYDFKLKIVPPFYNDSSYIHALSQSIAPCLQDNYDHVLFSYHGIPKRHVLKTDCTGSHCFSSSDCCSVTSSAHKFCYRHQVIATTNEVANKLNLRDDKFSIAFQSRLGNDEWLKPFTAEQLRKFPKLGVRKLVVVCPAFVSDCLETLEEIAVEGKEEFMRAGGETYSVVPCLNERDDWIKALSRLVNFQFQSVVA